MTGQQITASQRFKTDGDCYEYLAGIKWQRDEFVCKKCGNKIYCLGRTPYSHRCTRCKYDESVTVGTMFEKLKFPISKAFQMIFAMVAKDGATSMALAETLNLQQRTCWAFRLKVQQAMSHLHPKPLCGIVKVGFFNLINEQSDTYYWRFDKPRQRIAVALEIRDKKIIKAVADVVQDSKIDDLRQFIDAHIAREAQIEVAETRRGYKKLEKEYPSLKVYHGLLHLDRYFEGLKKWIYEVNYHFTYEHLQGYLDEYNFRINNRQNSFRKFETIVRAMMKNAGD